MMAKPASTRTRAAVFLETIKFSHTVFALPFALTGMVLAANGWPPAGTVFWIAAAMVGARTGAMGMNRVLDAAYDAKNPRTSERAIPKGLLSGGFVTAVSALSFGLLVFAASRLNTLCLILSPAAIGIVVIYSLTKRFTSLSHLVLGLSLALAPIGAWIAVRGDLSAVPLLLGAAVLLWVAGFDILYALQDIDFDRRTGLHSIPARLGSGAAVWISRLLHTGTVVLLAAVGIAAGRGWLYAAGVVTAGVLLAYEHSLVSPTDLSRLDTAFFNMNGWLSVAVFVFAIADLTFVGE
ncbi:MAG: 4-hydroxybenzoate octaprenyltransferase [Nitrospirae bacterium RBG_16_64_22]|nr:MAG: 4-hydroxybenzoate octaprenyltransferase [Nitrospirae bacterium RBG_16_64_22]